MKCSSHAFPITILFGEEAMGDCKYCGLPWENRFKVVV